MATVHTPGGETLSGVSGAELDYYRGEANTRGGYEIVEDDSLPSAGPDFPVSYEDGVLVEQPELPAPVVDEPGSQGTVEVDEAGFAAVGEQGPELQNVGSGEPGTAVDVPQNQDGSFGPAEVSNDPADSPKPRR